MRFIAVVFIAVITITHFGCVNLSHSDTAYVSQKKDIVILIHGIARNRTAMWKLDSRLEDAGYVVVRLDYRSLGKSIDEIKANVFKQINECISTSKTNNVHFVGHSLGGLLIRAYLQESKVAHLGRVVIMGSPNKGSEVVDYLKDKWFFSLAGPAANDLGTQGSEFLLNLQKPWYQLGVIAGDSKSKHNEKLLKGPDDGVVRVESTKVEGMTDFVIIETNHTMMRYNPVVAQQTIHFLKNGSFKK